MRIAMGLIATVVAGGCVDSVDTDETEQAASTARGGSFVTGGRAIDRSNPFFADLGTNGRTCEHCHDAGAGWTITPELVKAKFDATAGTDPLFRLVDGANSPLARVNTIDDRKRAYSMLLSKGLIRVGIGIPANAEFRLVAVDDPYGYASADELSLFRRPLPSTNTVFLATVMWDGRETTDPEQLHVDLSTQSTHATLGHAQALSADPALMSQVADFEESLFTAMTSHAEAGDVASDGARGGPENLAQQPFWIGINDPLGGNPTGDPFDPNVFTLFSNWDAPLKPDGKPDAKVKEKRDAIARGQQIFNTRTFTISGVAGLNDKLGVPAIQGTCSLCHDTPNVGNHSVPLPIDIGVSAKERRTPDMPLYTLERIADGTRIQTTDPGRALITGKWEDINKFKGPVLRGAALRAPYFHNGSARNLKDVVEFYKKRFAIGLDKRATDDLVAFLEAI